MIKVHAELNFILSSMLRIAYGIDIIYMYRFDAGGITHDSV